MVTSSMILWGRLVSTRYIILGLLAQQPMSGYDIKSLFKDLSWLVDTPSYGSLYPTLHALLAEDLVSVSIGPGQGKPTRKLYAITVAGQTALQSWFRESATAGLSIRGFARRLVVASSLSGDDLKDHLMQRRSQVVGYLTRPKDTDGRRKGGSDQQLVHDYGTFIAKAELAWLDEQLSKLLS